MTEGEWATRTDPKKLLKFLRRTRRAGQRKLRLFAAACCRGIWHLLPDTASRHAVEVAERYADGLAGDGELARACDGAGSFSREMWEVNRGTHAPARRWGSSEAAAAASWASAPPLYEEYPVQAAAYAAKAAATHSHPFDSHHRPPAERPEQCHLVRDLFGNPFRPFALHPAWRTPDVVRLAEAAYDDRHLPSGHLDAARLAVLADALEDAGCADAELLAHLRGGGPHVRGCFAVDLVLWKT